MIEIVIAPEADPEAAAILARRPALRLIVTGAMPDPKAAGREFRSLPGGILVQQRDTRSAAAADLRIVTRRAPSAAETADLLFADTVAKHVKSNAIVFARDGATVGIGAGQMSRVDAAKIAVAKALDMQRAAGLAAPPTKGAVMASDAFFPFADGLETGIAAGITAVIQPGRLAPRRRSDRRRRPRRHRHGLDRPAPLPPLRSEQRQQASLRLPFGDCVSPGQRQRRRCGEATCSLPACRRHAPTFRRSGPGTASPASWDCGRRLAHPAGGGRFRGHPFRCRSQLFIFL